MNIFVYSDESGVFDSQHNSWFVFGGVLFLSKDERDVASRKYIHAERTIRKKEDIKRAVEVKAAGITNKDKGKLFRSLNQYHKFGAVINQHAIMDSIFKTKKTKQRYLDYVFKIAVKRKFKDMIKSGIIKPDEVENLYFFADEHTTATDGRYELRENLEQEFKYGTYNYNYSCFFPPIFSNLQSVDLRFCNSSTVTLIRAADITANRLFFKAENNQLEKKVSNFVVTEFNPQDITYTI